MEVSENLMLQYVAAMAHQEVFQQQINIYKFIRNRLRRRRGARARRIWIRPWLHPERRLQFGIYDQLMLELRREDPRTFKKFLCMPTEMYDEIFGRVRHRLLKQHTRYRVPLDPGLKLAATLRHKVSGAKYSDMQYSWRIAENTLSVVVREVCQAICDEYIDEVMTAPATSEEWKQLADGFFKKWNFPNCVAAIDGKHIAIRKPASSSSLYYNYKG